jgi:chloramphenicol O-acetyltransferase
MNTKEQKPKYPTSVIFARSRLAEKFQDFQSEFADLIKEHKARYGCFPIFAQKAIDLTLQLTDEIERITQLAQITLQDALAEKKNLV